MLRVKNNQPQLQAESALRFTLRQRATVKKARVPDTSSCCSIKAREEYNAYERIAKACEGGER